MDKDDSGVVNDCYGGVLDKPDPTWSAVEAVYDKEKSAVLSADFGDFVEATAGADGKVSGSVTLSGNKLYELKDLFFLPASGCATGHRRTLYARPRGLVDRVVVRAVLADQITAKQSTVSSAKLKLKLKKLESIDVSGEVSGTTAANSQLTLSGTGLFYAEEIKEVTTRLVEVKASVTVAEGSPGVTKKLDTCRVSIAAVAAGKWSGKLVCDDGKTRKVAGDLGATTAVWKVEEGVTYGVFVEDAEGAGTVSVEVTRWVVSG